MDCECPLYPADLRAEIDGARLFYEGREVFMKAKYITPAVTVFSEDGSIPWKCAAAGNDIIMPGNSDDDKNIRQAYKEGKLIEEEIRSCAGHLAVMICRLNKNN